MENIMLIVDDVEVNREILKVLFEKDFDIMEADSGEEALAILEGCKGHIDIVLLDLIMPGLSGLELLEMRPNLDFFRDVPVVVISGNDENDTQVDAFQYGISDFIAKPFMPEIVVSRVNNVLASSRRFLSMELEKQKLRVKSEIDEMTGMFNKVTTEVVINETLKDSEGKLDVMMVIDIDNFKQVNDTSGHQCGDYVIKVIANLICGNFRKSDIIGRIGGDEFVVLMVNLPSVDIARDKANELIQIMRYKPNLTIPEYVTLSIGLASNERGSTKYVDLFNKADEALYNAKNGGKARYREYGIEPIDCNNDERDIAILLSNNRSVCSFVHAMLPERIRIIEALNLSDMDIVSAKDIDRAVLIFIDAMDAGEDNDMFWATVKGIFGDNINKAFAICMEGDTNQYMAALRSGVADMFTSPLNEGIFKRRTNRQLERLEPINNNLDDRVIHPEEL